MNWFGSQWFAANWFRPHWLSGPQGEQTAKVAAGWDTRTRRKRIVVEIAGRAMWFETLAEAQAAVDQIAQPEVLAELPPKARKLKVKVKPATISGETQAQEYYPGLDILAVRAWADQWNAIAADHIAQMLQIEAMRRQAEEDEDEALLLLL